ncbi:MAG: TIGR03986 family CRISPR-associated RAMP protein [Lachnospiraceae bacterium]|nr:TIGR03986 family CRISPR-associated RAMP protein [Lachnospiraceae bacterium]
MNYKPETKFVRSERGGHVHYEGSRGKADYNECYKPYFEEISYAVGDNGRVSGIRKNGLKYKGYVISTGKMNEKKAFYVIPEIDEDHEVSVSDEQIKEAVRAFQIDYNRRKNGLKDKKGKFIEFFDLPHDGETRPVFYIELGGRLYFGYTPRLRLMFEHTILDGLHQEEEITDFSKNMFGYSRQNGDSHKSRLFFTDAVITNQATVLQPKNLILAEPKPTSYLEYVCQNDGKPVKTYNDKDFRLRGTKQYWLQNTVNDGIASDKENVKSTIKPLKEGCTFEGKTRFQNLTALELGLLIWSVRLEKDSQMNVGKAKAYGYGRIKVNKTDLYLQNQQSAYIPGLEGLSDVQMVKLSEEERDTFINAYKVFLADWLKGEEHSASSWTSCHAAVFAEEDQKWAQKVLLQNPSLGDFFYMKKRVASGQMVQYMSLEKKPGSQNFGIFKQKNNPLPTVFDYRQNDSNRKKQFLKGEQQSGTDV